MGIERHREREKLKEGDRKAQRKRGVRMRGKKATYHRASVLGAHRILPDVLSPVSQVTFSQGSAGRMLGDGEGGPVTPPPSTDHPSPVPPIPSHPCVCPQCAAALKGDREGGGLRVTV